MSSTQTVPLALFTPGELRECDAFILHPNQANPYQVTKCTDPKAPKQWRGKHYRSDKSAHYIHIARSCGLTGIVRLWKEDKPIVGLVYCSACASQFYTKVEVRNYHDESVQKRLVVKCTHCSTHTRYNYNYSNPESSDYNPTHYPAPWDCIDDGGDRFGHPWVSPTCNSQLTPSDWDTVIQINGDNGESHIYEMLLPPNLG